MPFVLKEPCGDSKGIVIFTHKEKAFIAPNVPHMADAVERLKSRYVVGMHWGSPHDNIDTVPYVDFHLGGQGTISFKHPEQVRHLPLCSRNFLPPCFKKSDIPKHWDIIAVAGPRRLKRLDEFFVVLREIYDQRPETRVLIVSSCDKLSERDPELDYVEIKDDYARLFTLEEREKLTLMLMEGTSGMALSQETMAYFYNASRVFTLFTNKEGESRVIAEALLCGLPVVVKNYLAGGGRDYLTPENSRQFGTLDEAAQMFIELLDNYDQAQYDTAPLEQELSSVYSAQRLEAEMRALFVEKNIPFEGPMDLEHLSFKLPSHFYLTLPEQWRYATGNDLNSPASTLAFVTALGEGLRYEDVRLPLTKVLALRIYWRWEQTAKFFKALSKRPGSVLRSYRLLPAKTPQRATTKAFRAISAV